MLTRRTSRGLQVTILFEQGDWVQGFEILAKTLELDPTYRPPAMPRKVGPL